MNACFHMFYEFIDKISFIMDKNKQDLHVYD